MSDLLTEFKRDCEAVGVKPLEVFRAAKVNPSCWWRWANGTFSLSMKNFVAVRATVDALLATKGAEKSAAKRKTAA